MSLAPVKQDLSLTDLWLVIRKRRLMILPMAIGMAILVAGYGLVKGDQYTAKGEIQIQPGAAADLKQTISSALLTSR